MRPRTRPCPAARWHCSASPALRREALLQRGAVAISGDAELAQQFRELLGLLRPDPEEDLAGLLGDVPAHQLARLVRAGAGWSAQAAAHHAAQPRRVPRS